MKQIMSKDISCLKSYERNARTHSDKQVQQIKASINQFGFNNPILIDANNTIIAGHGRWLAAKQLNMTEVPTICLDHLSADEVRAYILADNRLAEKAGWDKSILTIELQHLLTLEDSFDVTLTGFELPEIELLIDPLNNEQDELDENLELKDQVITKLGDLWIMSKHRLLCGDTTSSETFKKLMSAEQANLCFTDPPYNVNYANNAKDKQRGTHRPILNDNLGDGFGAFLLAASQNILNFTDGAIYICMASSELHILQAAFIEAGGHWSTFLIWAKNHFTMGRSDYQRQYETILYGWREGTERYWCNARNQGDLWHFDKPNKNDLHPTMKPIGLVMKAIRNSSKRDQIVLDPFLGSGTTLLAAERTKRRCYGLELDPKYVDVIIRRWQKHTGLDAVHAETGKTFNEISTETGPSNE